MRLRTFVLTTVLIAAAVAVAAGPIVKVTVPDGTEVRLILKTRISSAEAQLDEKVRFELAEDLKVRGVLIARAGANAWGTVTEVNKKGRFGRNGKLNFTIDFVKLIDDQNLRLSGAKDRDGKNDYLKAGLIGYATGGLGALVVKGKDVQINAGTEYVLYTNGDRHLELDMGAAAANGNGTK